MGYDIAQNREMNRAHSGLKAPRGVASACCSCCKARKSRLALYRAAHGLVCRACSLTTPLFPAGGTR